MLSMFVFAWALNAQASFFPDTMVSLPRKASLADSPGMLRAERILERFQSHFAPVLHDHNAELVVIPHWEDRRVNALATRSGQLWRIEAYGGLLTQTDLSEDDITLVLCHELGHHLGGPPTASRNGWSASEGQADYWSAAACSGLLKDPEETALRLARLYAREGGGGWPELSLRDESRVARTFYGYPSPQCRLDTMIAGMKGMPRPECWYYGGP